MRHCMLDLETAGTRPGSIILSIGAVIFDENGVCPDAGHFHLFPDIIEQSRLGMTVDPSTFMWWLVQTKEAQDALSKRVNLSCGTNNVGHVLELFGKYYTTNAAVAIWGNGADFDIPLLATLYRAAGYGTAVPWKYNAGRCVRTLFGSIGKKLGDFGTANVLAHDALADSVFQATEAAAAMRYIDRMQPMAQLKPEVATE